jgi:hypothetical protein
MAMKKSIIMFSLIMLFGVLAADIVALYPEDDMYTDPDNLGTTPVVTELWTANYTPSGHFERIMMKFDLEQYSGFVLVSAELHLTRFYSCPSSGTTAAGFYEITEPWTEESWNYMQHISYNPETAFQCVFSGPGGSSVNHFMIDITDFINNWFINGGEDNGFVIIAQDGQKFSKFYSKEFSNADYRPRLVLELENTDTNESQINPSLLVTGNYPNPFNPETTIFYELLTAGMVDINIYNVRGRLVTSLLSDWHDPGSHKTVWAGCDDNDKPVSSGVYLYQIKAGTSSSYGQMLLLK